MHALSTFDKLIIFFAILFVLISIWKYFTVSESSAKATSLSRHQIESSVSSLPQNPTPTITVPGVLVQVQSSEIESTKERENYKLTTCENDLEGCYSMNYSHSEEMATSEELNSTINDYRQAHDLNIIYIDPQICSVAEQRANEIKSDFSHNGFRNHAENGDYDFLGYSQIAENLWQGEFSAVHIVEFGWDRSEGHRKNLQGNWTRGCSAVSGFNAVFIFVN